MWLSRITGAQRVRQFATLTALAVALAVPALLIFIDLRTVASFDVVPTGGRAALAVRDLRRFDLPDAQSRCWGCGAATSEGVAA